MKTIFFIIAIATTITFVACNKEVRNSEKPIKVENKVEIKKDKTEIVTEDKINLAADYYYYSDKKDTIQPLIILIHQFRSNKEQWRKSFIDTLLNKNYKVFAYDIRNHGESGKSSVDLMDLLSDREQAPKDVDAVLKWAFSQKGVDSSRVGIIGTSIGASLAIYGRLFKGAKSVVAVSGGKGTFQAFTGYDDRMMSSNRMFLRIKNVMFICGTADNGYLEEEKNIYDNYLMDPREIMKFESGKHGKDLIDQYPEILTAILNWFGKTL